VQVHEECVCGHNVVYQTFFPVKWKDLPACEIRRKRDATTGRTFLLKYVFTEVCPGWHDDEAEN
jgi:hypothetical protein